MCDGVLSVIAFNNRQTGPCTLLRPVYTFRLLNSVSKIFSCTVTCKVDYMGLHHNFHVHSITFCVMYTLKDCQYVLVCMESFCCLKVSVVFCWSSLDFQTFLKHLDCRQAGRIMHEGQNI